MPEPKPKIAIPPRRVAPKPRGQNVRNIDMERMVEKERNRIRVQAMWAAARWQARRDAINAKMGWWGGMPGLRWHGQLGPTNPKADQPAQREYIPPRAPTITVPKMGNPIPPLQVVPNWQRLNITPGSA